MRTIFVLAAAMLSACVVLARVLDRGGHGVASPAVMAAAPDAAIAEPPNSRTVVLSRGNGGHFWTEARVDGRRLQLVVDTGASQVALRASDAALLGIHPTARDYSIRVSTANGITRAALVELGRVEVGDIVVRNVQALVHADEGLGVNLLGMSFLSRVRWTHERGKLILEQ
jgi:aspartyl protease family protein